MKEINLKVEMFIVAHSFRSFSTCCHAGFVNLVGLRYVVKQDIWWKHIAEEAAYLMAKRVEMGQGSTMSFKDMSLMT